MDVKLIELYILKAISRVRNLFSGAVVVLAILFQFACSNSGVQGTSLYSKFLGINSIEAISPTAIRINWGLDANYSEYRIYENEGVSPVKTETFGTTAIENLRPNTIYYYQISGYSEKSGEVFTGSKMPVSTLENFSGLTSSGVTLKSTTEVKLSWVMNSNKTKFKIFHKLQSAAWNTALPTTVIAGGNQYTIGNLVSGSTYCFYIEAEYLDGTHQPTATTESQINALAQCKQMTSPLPSLPSVNVSSYTFGDFPWFWTANGDPTYKIDILELGTDRRIASRTGNGYFRSSVSLASETKYYYALVTNMVGEVSTVSVDIIGSQSRPNNYIRKLNVAGDRGPIYPPILSDGFGAQNLGGQLVSGDFNCDGLPDLAASSISSVPFDTPQHYTSIGAVTIYYTYEYVEFDEFGSPQTHRALKRNVLPSSTAAAPNPQLISYPVTSTNTQFGIKLAVGNFNGDCYQKNFSELNLAPRRGSCDLIYKSFSAPAKTAENYFQTKKCDDLAVSTATGSFFIIYGDPNLGLVSGSMSNTYGIDEQTCDAVSSTCRASQYKVPSGYNTSDFAQAIAVGDYNNDGFDDLAVAAKSNVDSIRDIFIYRGDSLGLFPSSHSSSFSSINVRDGSTGLSAPEQVLSNNDDFGFSLTAVPNSRTCVKDLPAGAVYRNASYFPTANSQSQKGLHASKCADLVIGAPERSSSRGSIYSCRGSQPTSGDKQKITSWTCKEHYPNILNGEPILNYGYSLLGVANQNGYAMADNIISGVPSPWGSLFVGAPNSTINAVQGVGSVYGYYVTRTTGDNYLFGIQTAMGGSTAHTITADNAVPCDQTNNLCQFQRIYPATAQANMKFGTKLTSIFEKAGQLDPWMPMLAVSAPYRDNINTSGQTILDAGAVYLYRGDISNFMNQDDNGVEITFPRFNSLKPLPCNDGNCTWLSGGVSPFGSTLLYNKYLKSYSHFGMVGAVGILPTSDYSFNDDMETDIFTSAPSNNSPTTNNGGIYGFYSSAGSFSPTVVTPDISIETNQSLEGNYKFEEAKVVGDINADGYDDVMAHINNNNNWVTVIYYGSANGLVQTPAPSFNAAGLQPKLFKSSVDTTMGIQFFPAGDVNDDGFADVVLLSGIAGRGSYLFYGSGSGLVTSVEPDISPVGKNALKFAVGGNNAVTFSSTNIVYSSGSLNKVESYNHDVQSVTYGKFNNDNYDDIVIHVKNTATLPAASQNGNLDYLGTGRVFIIYGGSNGPKLNTSNGRILLEDGLGNPADVVTDNPCDPINNSICKVQMITSPNSGADLFGFSVQRRSLFNATLSEYDGLLLSDPSYSINGGNNDGAVYVYQGSSRGLVAEPIQTLLPRDNNTYFGYSLAEIGDVNADQSKDIAISAYSKPASSPRAQVITVFYGKTIQGKSAYAGDSGNSLAGTNYWSAPAILDNKQLSGGLRPQVINPIINKNGDYLGYGMVGLKDINNDGFSDLAVNVPNGDFNISGNVSQTGYIIIFFGGPDGLQIDSSKITPSAYPRCYQGTTPVCDPYQIYLPGYIENDYTQINPFSTGDLNGDGLNDLMIGALGRSHPSGKGISTGVIYVLY